METFSVLLALCGGKPRSPVDSPYKGQWHIALMFSLSWTWANNRDAGYLRCHRTHYDVILMQWLNAVQVWSFHFASAKNYMTSGCIICISAMVSSSGIHWSGPLLNTFMTSADLWDRLFLWVTWLCGVIYDMQRGHRSHGDHLWLMIFSVSEIESSFWGPSLANNYGDVIMGSVVSQITSLTIDYSTVYSDAGQRKHQRSASLAFVWWIHRGPVNSPHKWPVTWKMFPFDDVIMDFSSVWNRIFILMIFSPQAAMEVVILITVCSDSDRFVSKLLFFHFRYVIQIWWKFLSALINIMVINW